MFERRLDVKPQEDLEVRGQRDRRGRSLEFMMRLESRFRLSEGTETRFRFTQWLSLSAGGGSVLSWIYLSIHLFGLLREMVRSF